MKSRLLCLWKIQAEASAGSGVDSLEVGKGETAGGINLTRVSLFMAFKTMGMDEIISGVNAE